MPWYKVVLTNTQVGQSLERLHDVFFAKLLQHGGDKDMVIFECRDEEDEEQINLYVSPKMAEVSPRELVAFSGVEVPAPTGSESEFAVLIASDDQAAFALLRSSQSL